MLLAFFAALIVLPWLSATRRIWLLLVHSFSIVALVSVGVEMALHAAHPPYRDPSRYPYPYRMHGFAPNMRAAENEYHVTTNNAGMRAPGPIPLRKPPGTLRVLVLGGSAMFGVGAPDGHSAPDHLERILNADPKTRPPGITRIEVLNASQGWYGSTQELVYFVTDLWRYEPDVVLVVDGYNDLHHSLVWGLPPPLTSVVVQHVNQMRVLPGFSEETGWKHVVAAAVDTSALRRALKIPPTLLFSLTDQRLGSADLHVADSRPSEDEVFRTLLANWAALDAVARRNGSRVHFSLQPVIYTKKPQSPQEAGFFQQTPYAQAVGDAWRHLEAYVARKAPAYGLDVFASDRYVRNIPDPVFGDHCHMDSRGYERVARAMAEVVRRDLRDWPWKTAFVPDEDRGGRIQRMCSFGTPPAMSHCRKAST